MVIVRFKVGQAEEAALVRLNQKLAANADRIPPGVVGPIVKPRSIDDVPIMAVTVWSERYGDDQMRALAAQLRDAIAEVTDVSEVTLIGGRPRQLRVDVDPSRLAAYDAGSARRSSGAIAATNARDAASGSVAGGQIDRSGSRHPPEDGRRRASRRRQHGSAAGPSRVSDLADGQRRRRRARRRTSPISRASPARIRRSRSPWPSARAPTPSTCAHRVAQKLDTLKGTLVPVDVHLTVTRDYGETAAEKSNELLWHMLLAVLSVSALIWLVLGRREAAVVLIAIPVTLALTLFTFYLYGYTLNRITLFALIFSIGILVDDAIVVVENIVRHARLRSGESSGLDGRGAAGRGRSRQPHHPGDACGDGRDPADGLRRRPDGAVHAADSDRRVGRDGVLARRRVRGDAVGGGAAAEAGAPPRAWRGEDRFTRLYRRVMGPLLSNGPMRALLSLGRGGSCCWRRSPSCPSGWSR